MAHALLPPTTPRCFPNIIRSMATPEQLARLNIDAALEAAGWAVQSRDAINIGAARGVAIREFPLERGHGFADYLLYVDGRAAGAVEAKPEGSTLKGVEVQSKKYSEGLPEALPAWVKPLPFLYESTGVETQFTNRIDPEPRSRNVFSFHQPATLAAWAEAKPSVPGLAAEEALGYDSRSTLRKRLRTMPPLADESLRAVQRQAVLNLERSLADDRPRALIQMATGSGKTRMAVAAVYRLIKHAGAQRVLFLVDRGNLGRQALGEFQRYRTPDDGRLFSELYNVQLMTSNRIDPVSKVYLHDSAAVLDPQRRRGAGARPGRRLDLRLALSNGAAAGKGGIPSRCAARDV